MKIKPVFVVQCHSAKRAGGIFIFILFILSLLTPVATLRSEEKAKISNPSKFKVSLSLPKVGSASQSKPGAFGAKGFSSGAVKASIAVNILDGRFYPVKTYVLRDLKKKDQAGALWDGRDIYGKEMPAGDYYASLSIVYSDGSKESRFYKFVKE